MRAIALAAAVAFALLAPAAPAALAAPGSHMWFDTVFNAGGSGDEAAVAVTADGAGRSVVVGDAVTSPAGDFDIRYVAYDLAGVWRWNAVVTTWDNPTNPGASDTAAGVVVDAPRSCVYVAGTTRGATGDEDVVVLKVIDGLGGWLPGELAWAAMPGTAVGQDDEAEAVALDANGNVYVAGGAQRADGSMDVITMKFRPDGALAWTRRHNNSTTRFDRGLAIAVRGSAVYVAGISNRRGHGDDLVLVKYSLGGARRWVRYYDDPLNRHESLSGMAVTAGAVYLCGSGKVSSRAPGDALLVKFRSDGRRAWVRWAAGNAGGHDAWTDVAVDGKGRVHVTGSLERKATGHDVVTATYSSAGVLAWQRGYSTIGRRMDLGAALAVDPGGRTYVCGFQTAAAGDTDVVVLKYGPTGTTLWTTVYPDPAAYPVQVDLGDDWAADVAVGGGLVVAAGRQMRDHGGVVDADFLTLAIER